jgi:RNA polymerase sigma factor (sigma-70 family)
MMFPFSSKPESRPTFEDVFFEHRVRLYEFALQLTGRNHAEAEDLVQELYIRLARVGTVPGHIENAEHYLFSMLRNLYHKLARRARTSAIDDLSIVDYDSAERSLHAVDRHGIFFVREDLFRVCDYLCERKNSSRSASIFILRYLLGYYPSEVMKVVQSTRGAVDKAIRAARNEARMDLERPGVLQHMGSAREPRLPNPNGGDDSLGLYLALRERIFRSCPGECLSCNLLRERYEQPGDGFATIELAHLVSCAACLDRANRMLGLPLLLERSPDETIGRDTPQGPDGSAGGAPKLVSNRAKSGSRSQDLPRMRKRMHRRLGEVNEHRPQRLSIAVDGDIRASQRVTASLSELLAELHPADRPAYIEVLSEQNVCLFFVLVQKLAPEGGLLQVRNIQLSDDRTLAVFISFEQESPTIRVIYNDPLLEPGAELEEESTSAMTPDILAPRNFEWLRRRVRPLFASNMHPLLATATLFALCSIFCLLLWTQIRSRTSAVTILSRAQQSDAAVVKGGHAEVVYQKVRIAGSGRVMDRAIYRDPQKKRRLKQQHLKPDDQQLKDKLNLAGVNWDEPLSSANYREWHDSLAVKRDVVTRAGANLLMLTTSSGSPGPVSRESLTVRESDFHPVERTIELRGAGQIEIAELSYDMMPWGAVNQDWFEPFSTQSLDHQHATLAPILPRAVSASELDSAELSARLILNQLHADTGEQILVSRTNDSIEVKGVVETNQRKRELAARLLQVPHVHSSLLSVEELGRHLQTGSTSAGQIIQSYSVEPRPSPLEQYLREKGLPLDRLQNISQSLLEQSIRTQQAGIHLSALRQRFRAANQLPPDQRNQLMELSRNYVNALEAGLEANQHTLSSIGLVDTQMLLATTESGLSGEDIDLQVRHHQELCQQLVSSESGEAQSAAELADKLIHSGALIRATAVQIHTSVSTAHN